MMRKTLEIEEVLIDLGNEERIEAPLKESRLVLVFFVSLLGVGALLAKTSYLQLVRGNYYQEKALKNPIQTETIPAPRGFIFDRYFNVLAENLVIDRGLTKRIYNSPEAISHLVGYVHGEAKAKTGLELKYDDELRGQDGYNRFEIDSTGKGRRPLSVMSPVSGHNLVLHLDLELQKKIYERLPLEKKSSVVAIDPNGGGILALVSSPGFDNNLFVDFIKAEAYQKIISDPRQILFNRVIGGQYPPGSTVKIFMAASALQEKLIDPYKKEIVPFQLSIRNKYNPDIVYIFPDWKKHGPIDMFEALQQSSNVYFYGVGEALGWRNIKKYMRFFGFGEKTGIDLPGEAAGFIPSKGWLGDIYHTAIGQGDTKVTVLQLAMATAAIANEGKLYEPQIVDKVIDQDNNIVKDILPVVRGSGFISPENLELVRRGMISPQWQIPEIKAIIAGKTGTAQFGPEQTKYHSWFTSFSKSENNQPELVVTVLVEEGGSGSGAALSIAKEIYKIYYQIK